MSDIENLDKLDKLDKLTLNSDDTPRKPALLADVEQERHVYNATTKLSAIMTVIFSGIALVSDGYNVQVIGYLMPLFANLYPDSFTPTLKTRISNAFFIRQIVGMLAFGALIDRIGRKFGIVLTTLLLIAGIALSAASHGTSDTGMFWMLIVARGLAGVGAGGEYPVCATSSIEAADETAHVRKHRGFLVASVGCFAIDTGFVVAGLGVLIILAAYGGSQLGFRVFYLAFRRYWRRIIGTCLCWFLYNFTSYPFGLFTTSIVSQLNPQNTIMQNIGWGTLVLAFLPFGCLVGGVLMDVIGRKQTQALGFIIQNHPAAFIVVYGLFLAAAEAGPGVATLLISGEVYPTALRGHMLGLSAAFGKAGAAIGTQVFNPIQNAFEDEFKGQQAVFLIGSAISILGAIATLALIPNHNDMLEDEDEAWRAYLEENGVSTSNMGEPIEASAAGGMRRMIEQSGMETEGNKV
ncbi:hypothetical protein CcaverHIS002_0503350 [Cutaneotrichosporon cavernicola]|nr:hypothetical protein CcaverHIS002_0503350 [Cutaneotrichosporon cavernicola]